MTQTLASDGSAHALVIHCSDYRWRRAFTHFAEETLGIAEYDVVAVPGGPQFLAVLEYLPKLAWAGHRWTRFLVDAHNLSRVVLIAHEGCQWYQRMHGEHADIEPRQRHDLEHASRRLAEMLPVRVEAFFARHRDGKVVFDPLAGAAHQ